MNKYKVRYETTRRLADKFLENIELFDLQAHVDAGADRILALAMLDAYSSTYQELEEEAKMLLEKTV